jgi:prephenate dehydrogenase
MKVQIAVLGLDRSSISAAMVLSARHKDIHCKGWDADREKCIAAADAKIFQPVCTELKEAVKDAALVLTTLSPHVLQSALAEWQSANLPKAVLVNLAPGQEVFANIIETAWGADAAYFSMLPALNPLFMDEAAEEQAQPRADLFSSAHMYVSASPRANEALLNLAADLAVMLGGRPMFAEACEVDGLTAANLLLPQMSAGILMDAVSGQPSWRDGQQLAGNALACGSEPVANLAAADWAERILADPENNLRVLDNLAGSLQAFRQALQQNDQDGLEALLRQAQEARSDWLRKRESGAPAGKLATSVPSEKDALENILKLGR